jgi:hypothetical protein
MAEERFLFLSPTGIRFGVTPNRNVSIGFAYDKELGLSPGLQLAMELTPSEARGIAAMLNKKADEAQGTTIQH